MKRKGYVYAIVAAILFGTAGIFVKFAHRTGLDSVELLICQYMLAVVIMLGILIGRDRKNIKNMMVSAKEMGHLAVLGVLGNICMTVFYYKAFEYLPVAMVTMLLYTYPIMVFLFQSIMGKEKITTKKVIALLLAFVGGLLALDLLKGELIYSKIGIIFGVLSAVFYAFMNIYSEKYLKNVEALKINSYSTMFSLLLLLVYKSPLFLGKLHFSMELAGSILSLAFFCEIIPLTLLYAALKEIGAVKVSIISNLEIPMAICISYLILGEAIAPVQIIGTVLIIAAVYMIKGNEA